MCVNELVLRSMLTAHCAPAPFREALRGALARLGSPGRRRLVALHNTAPNCPERRSFWRWR